MKNELNIKNKLGLGTAPLGNMFRAVPEDEAMQTIQSAWEEGIRYFDTAPFYGAGLAEIRLGEVLSSYQRDDFLLSSRSAGLYWTKRKKKRGCLSMAARIRSKRITRKQARSNRLKTA